MKKIVTLSLIVSSLMLFSGCTSSKINMEKQTPSFQLGAKDGCATANGEYTKNHDLFQSDSEYNNGWFYGRKTCNPSDSRK
ncbi:hypothetical protein MNB_SV-5-718 [hydrothermal vent metagenome]|uniref:Lipoprotein n=1 Tax=hydrothermal vent metagenome TaxID=652676 RepID=A0A1W1EDQ1_9ZZZZ